MMPLRSVRALAILAIHLIIFLAESSPTEHLNRSAPDFRQRRGWVWNSKKLDEPHQQWKIHCMRNEDDPACNEVYDMPVNGSHYPQKIRIPRASKAETDDIFFGGDKWTSCRIPSDLKTAEIRCKRWPSSVKCISYCVYGSTFDEGVQRMHSCKYKENKWSKEFDECRPFIDCRVIITSPGYLRCVKNEVLKTPKCEIECEMYEDKDEVKKQVYACHADGTWKPNLPFCAKLRGDAHLARAPKVTELTQLLYP